MENLAIIITSILAGVATYYISIKMGKGAVFGSAVVVLVSGVMLPHFIPDIGGKLAVVATTASYAGMVSVKNVPKLWEMAVVGLIAAVLFIFSAPAYIGVGGKLGTIAAIACLSWVGLKKCYEIVISTENGKATVGKPVKQGK